MKTIAIAIMCVFLSGCISAGVLMTAVATGVVSGYASQKVKNHMQQQEEQRNDVR